MTITRGEMDNYPPDIRQYDNDHRSPFYVDPCYGCNYQGDCELEPSDDCKEQREEYDK